MVSAAQICSLVMCRGFFIIIIVLKDKADISQLSVQTAARVFWEQLPLL